MRRWYAWVSMLLALGACADTPSEPEEPKGPSPHDLPFQDWSIHVLTFDEAFNDMNAEGDVVQGGVDDGYALGLTFTPPIPDDDGIATAEVFATETGTTYWVSAQSPSGVITGESVVGGTAELEQYFSYRKDSENATLRFTITGAYLELLDDNVHFPLSVCNWQTGTLESERGEVCRDVITAAIEAGYTAYTADPAYAGVFPVGVFFATSGRASIRGFATDASPTYTAGLGFRDSRPVFGLSDFELHLPDGDPRHLQLRLGSPIAVDIPLDAIDVGTEFTVVTSAEASAWSRRLNESYAAAYFRDPVSTGAAATVEYTGLTPLEPPSDIPDNLPAAGPAPSCEGGAAGTIGFAAASYFEPEWPGDAAEITITRTGGAGEASVLLTTDAGTATPGSDYEPVTTHVWFGDTASGTRVVVIPIIPDRDPESNETVMLTLSDPRGCAGLGVTSAVLTIRDDDQPLPAVYSVGGTVTGLEGAGLELRDGGTSVVSIARDGSWAFPADYAAGATYDVTVGRQPGDPLQACTVTNGQGTVGEKDVTDIVVTCAPPAADDGLDPDFGTGGIAKVNLTPYSDYRFATALALQDDGKILAVGTNTLVRYHADGTRDTGFGTGGEVRVAFRSGSEHLHAVAVQPDGRILVAGTAVDAVNLPANDDFALARFEADGTPDTGFGDGGVVVTDFNGRLDLARDILVQPDGAIVVAGTADAVDQFGATDPDFALARYTSAGDPDPHFGAGGDGRATVDIGGRLNGGYAAALQSDGRIVVVGTVAASRGSDPDLGVARFDRNGALDPTFGTGGIVWDDTPAEAEWALDVAVDANDRILVSGSRVSGGDADAFVARYDAGGDPDAGFGNSGVAVNTLLWGANGLALDAGGGILIVGATPDDFGVVRLGAGGAPDTGFGDGGLIAIDFFGGFDEASDVVIQPDGRILAGGKIEDGLPAVGLARVLPVAGSRLLRAGRRP